MRSDWSKIASHVALITLALVTLAVYVIDKNLVVVIVGFFLFFLFLFGVFNCQPPFVRGSI